ncbi:hypothetical protein FXN67_24915 [Klebsiella pneumoniae]|uniref:Uncharacterized protein n=1 Tax=Klebsiella pneumoniae TaxID=573 RepID=A0A5D3JRD1_KLEPN|nr:hypothetical protein FXN67_24915 [Klebsiella pneumoniae]
MKNDEHQEVSVNHINVVGDWRLPLIAQSCLSKWSSFTIAQTYKNNLNEWKGLPLIMRLINSCAIMG